MQLAPPHLIPSRSPPHRLIAPPRSPLTLPGFPRHHRPRARLRRQVHSVPLPLDRCQQQAADPDSGPGSSQEAQTQGQVDERQRKRATPAASSSSTNVAEALEAAFGPGGKVYRSTPGQRPLPRPRRLWQGRKPRNARQRGAHPALWTRRQRDHHPRGQAQARAKGQGQGQGGQDLGSAQEQGCPPARGPDRQPQGHAGGLGQGCSERRLCAVFLSRWV
jgi:hypothetical protein